MMLCSTGSSLHSVSASKRADALNSSARRALRRLQRTAELLTHAELPAPAVAQFARYLELLVTWSRAQRLTGYSSADEIVRNLMEDALLFLRVLPDARPLRVVDIGAGAGIPGVPLSIVDPGLQITLIEARRKRVSFLRTVRREVGLDRMSVVEGRAEDLDVAELGLFDVAVARSVAKPEVLFETAGRLVVSGGLVISTAAPRATMEVPAPAAMRAQVVRLPDVGLERSYWIGQTVCRQPTPG